MDHDERLVFADHFGRFYVRQYGIPPVAGRLLGYLAVCEPAQQSIAELADALMASRSAIAGAVKVIENMHLLRRTRTPGERVDRIALDFSQLEQNGFGAEEYITQAALAREGLELLNDASPERRKPLEELAALGDFLAARMPQLLDEWHAYRDAASNVKRKGLHK